MKRSLTLAVALTALCLAAPAVAQQDRFFPWQPKVTKLENGFTVVRLQFPSKGLLAYYTVVRVGSRNEVEPGHTGFAHFFEHMMFKGTPTRPEGVRDRILATAGFNDNAFTTDDFTVYEVYGPADALATVVELEADRFRNLAYSEQTFQTEAKAVLGEYHKNAANPGLKLEEAMLDTAFNRHTYQHTTLGFYDDIKKMPGYYEYSKQFFQRWYTPENSVLVVVGDFDDEQLMAAVRQHYGPWQGKAADVKIPAEPSQRELRTATVEWEGRALPRYLLAWHTPAAKLNTLDAATQEVLAAYLVGPTSKLYKDLVLERQIVEDLGTWFFPHRDPYLFTISATLKDEKHRPAVDKAFNQALRNLVTNGADPKQVEAIKQNARYGTLMGLESADQVAGQFAWYIGIYGDPDAIEQHLKSVSKVTANDLRQFAKEYLTALNRTEVNLVLKPAAAKGGKQ